MNAADKVEIVTGKSSVTYDKIIICAGVWSKKIAGLIGDNVPIESERGYHISYNDYNPIKHPVAWQERGTYFTPMNNGLRVAGTVEFAGLDREINRKVINFLSRSAKQVFPEISSHDSEWLGFRPSAPDSLPVIGQSKKNPYIYYCFGHQHIGWSLGGITGKLIAQEAIANKTDIDLTPFSVGRF
jgi:D-amino-acid dehydrogenase